ncbi:M16 family metallopeptidase [Acinetobacter pseudolwoffii]|uniref:M16 family metallopeptidase n=1 Tax=Acinetobacter pseudolwoffii TaxID=2053287 RepID=UPI002469527C|nr:pitrilysin family protein [Acinetobacter pseudolwoffii]MDH5818871.1 pitrilysin family protein [Acinetobacter pseudolwoffii]
MLVRYKNLSLAILLSGCSALSFAQPVLVKTEQNVEEYRLDNGLRIILAPNDKENKIFMNTVYLTGSLNDPKGKGGLAHLLEHLAFKGTKNVKGDEFQRRLDQYTLMTNASTDYYSTKYTNVIRPEKTALSEVIFLEAERMDQLVLQEKYVPTEIDIVKREREIRLDQPFSVLMDQVFKSAYGNQYLGRLPIGDLNELQSINMQELNQFYRSWYAPNNAFMVISGKFDKAEVLKQIDSHFSPIQSRSVPAQVKVPALKPEQIQQREFTVQKGSDLAKFNIYLNGPDEKIKTALAVSPTLYTLQPSGHLYQSMVESGKSTMVQSSTWLDKDFNLVFMGAIYAPNHQPKTVEQSLIQGVEQSQPFTEAELNRVKNLTRNQADNIKNSATALGSRLSDYAVAYSGDWSQYFKDLNAIENLNVSQVNQVYKGFLKPEYRISGNILPTPEDQKKAQEVTQTEAPKKTLDQQAETEEPLKDVSVYQAEVKQYVAQSKQYLSAKDKQIQRGKLKNGIKYALFPTNIRDDKVYATISLDFGTAQSLMNKGEILDLTAYLMLRSSESQSLQQIADKIIEVGGSATASPSSNGLNIQISAKKEKFAEFFQYVVDVLKNPAFEQSQFNLIKGQTLSSLDRPYTEPDTVSSLTMARTIEVYQPGDIRFHFEPELATRQFKAATREQVVALYQQFFKTHHAHIAVTGEFQPKSIQKMLKNSFADWKAAQPYERLKSEYRSYPAQKIHALSEQREFGSYQALLTFPVGADHADVPALQVFRHILGDSQLSSRLAQELREKNALVYGFSAHVQFNEWADSGALALGANYTAGKSAQVSQTVHQVLNELLTRGVTEQEVEAAKASILKKRVNALEDDRRIHSMLVPQLEKDRKLIYREKRDQAIAQLTKADIDAVIKKYIKLDQLVEVMADQYGKQVKTS